MFAFDLEHEGRVKWRAFGDDSDDESLMELRSLGPPCIVGDSALCLAMTTKQFTLVDLDLNTGKPRSQTKLSAAKPTYRTARFSPVIAGNRLICPCPTNELVAVLNDGHEIQWRTAHGKPLGPMFRIDVAGSFILTLCDGTATCFDLDSGKPVWSRDGLELYPFVRSGNTQILGSNTTVVAIDIPTGKELWNTAMDSGVRIAANGTMHKGNLILPLSNKTLMLSDAGTGERINTMTVNRSLGHLYSIHGFVYSLNQSSLDKLTLADHPTPEKAEP
jgi:outer membrane protein assembly factor BamB